MRKITPGLVAAFLLIFWGCDEPSDTEFNRVWENDVVEIFQYAQDGEEYFFLRQRTSNFQMDALITGEIDVQGGCTVLNYTTTDQATIIWPEDFNFEKINNSYRISGPDISIQPGDSLRISGGFYSQVPETFCTGSFWLAGNEVEVLD